MRIAILCNDRIALPALDHLLNTGETVAVGMPNRKHETQMIAANRCHAAHVPFQLFNKKNLATDLQSWLEKWQPDVVLVKTFPFLIPAEALHIPRYGFINFHYAPLPAWRGANPLFWMLRNQAVAGGVTVHEMNNSYDAGPVLLQQSIPIGNNINFGIFYTQLAYLGLQLTVQLLNGLQNNSLQRKEQDHAKAQWYGHPQQADLLINWDTMNATEIIALVRACNPWNKGAGTNWKGWTFGITYASVIGDLPEKVNPGTILSLDAANGFAIATKDQKAVMAEVVYCEEGFYPGYCLSAFGLQIHDRLT